MDDGGGLRLMAPTTLAGMQQDVLVRGGGAFGT